MVRAPLSTQPSVKSGSRLLTAVLRQSSVFHMHIYHDMRRKEDAEFEKPFAELD